jgi:hypothetical protein
VRGLEGLLNHQRKGVIALKLEMLQEQEQSTKPILANTKQGKVVTVYSVTQKKAEAWVRGEATLRIMVSGQYRTIIIRENEEKAKIQAQIDILEDEKSRLAKMLKKL